ncbi:MAG: hypothetical protein JWO30_4944 [Fibrobacteres bacterium]|nr:hypothetical protein [Fibrobacterota bacterium]
MIKSIRTVLAGTILLFFMSGAFGSAAIPTKVLIVKGMGSYPFTNLAGLVTGMLQSNASAWNLEVTVADSANDFTLPYLRGFDAVLLNHNSGIGWVIQGTAQDVFAQWMREGGGVVGLHGVMMHQDSWKWFADSVAMTNFHNWNTPGNQCDPLRDPMEYTRIQVDTLPTSGTVRARKPEYAPLLAMLPAHGRDWCDRWMEFTTDPRRNADVLMTVDARSMDTSSHLGGDYPVAWARKLPIFAGNGRQGRFFHTSLGYFPDMIQDPMIKDLYHFSLCWAAGREYSASSCLVPDLAGIQSQASSCARFKTSLRDGVLKVGILGAGKHVVRIYALSGRKVAQATGTGDGDFVFANPGPGVFLIQVETGNRVSSRRVVL